MGKARMSKLAWVLCLAAIWSAPAAAQQARGLDTGRFQIASSDGHTFLIDTQTGRTWRWVWSTANSSECQGTQTPPGCRIWSWQALTTAPSIFGRDAMPPQ